MEQQQTPSRVSEAPERSSAGSSDDDPPPTASMSNSLVPVSAAPVLTRLAQQVQQAQRLAVTVVPHGGSATMVPYSSPRQNSGATCFLCLKAKAVCDLMCPCQRCITMKVPHMCLSADSISKRISSFSSTRTTGKVPPLPAVTACVRSHSPPRLPRDSH
eukprot:TRINITY_DN1313_c0_g1_i5.p1 TRINITY_DN1313_c0_g1~~TRINITY_DN1313_c0_g1_i5.p1  ORF type:complete len:159 (-),score=42.45 TRINITY_DN1313_c0_g1_i5:333-809(-)